MTIARGIVRHLTRRLSDKNVVIGPPLWHPQGGAYFVVAVSRGGFVSEVVRANRGVDVEELRHGVAAALKRMPGLIVHDLDDELATVQACETLWPCEATRRIANQLATERAFQRHVASGLFKPGQLQH